MKDDGSLVSRDKWLWSQWRAVWVFSKIFNDIQQKSKFLDTARQIYDFCKKFGWDDSTPGWLLRVSGDGKDDVGWEFADTKLWWPHTEALYGLLLACEYTQADWCLDWYEKVHEYSFSHYPVPKHGEWAQKLNRQGKKITDVVALPVKDPFHLPRAVIYCIDVLQRLVK